MTNNPAPAGYTTVAPRIVTDDTGAFLDFVSAAFGGTELARVPTEDGSIGHGVIRVTAFLWYGIPPSTRGFVTQQDQAGVVGLSLDQLQGRRRKLVVE